MPMFASRGAYVGKPLQLVATIGVTLPAGLVDG